MELSDTTINRYRAGLTLLLMLALAIIVSNCLIIAAPGFFSHDEWQRFDDVAAHGLQDYARRFVHLHAGYDFGTPFRPIGFLEEGFSTLWMERLPFVPHLIDVLLHTGIALLLYLTLRKAQIGRHAAALAALLFGISPLTIMATGWVAASFDLWYTLFVVLACFITVQICTGNTSIWRLALLAAASAGAILSKETGIATPAAVAVAASACFLASGKKMGWRKICLCTATSAGIVALYLLFRLPALTQTFAGTPTAAYTPGSGNLLRNLTGYIAYPFLPGIAEIVNFPLVSPYAVGLALLAHALLPVGIARRFGMPAACLYVIAYLTFILPVVSLPSGGSHYLYACAIPMGVATGGLLHSEWTQRSRLGLGILVVLIAILTFHTWRNETFIYNTALCQTRFIDSLDTRLSTEASRGTQTLLVRPDADAPAYVGLRAVHGRARYAGENGPSVIMDINHTEQEGNHRTTAVMTNQCTIR